MNVENERRLLSPVCWPPPTPTSPSHRSQAPCSGQMSSDDDDDDDDDDYGEDEDDDDDDDYDDYDDYDDDDNDVSFTPVSSTLQWTDF